jgi:hypothetical protein
MHTATDGRPRARESMINLAAWSAVVGASL